MSKRITTGRRCFLKQAAAVSLGAVGVPWVVPAGVFGQEKVPAPSGRIGLAFLGPGGRGKQLVREMAARPEVETLAVSDVSRGNRELVQKMVEQLVGEAKDRPGYRACRVYRDFREVLDRRDVDAVVVSAPEHWRPIMCIMAAQAGKDIFTEKPLAITIKEAQALAEAVRRYGRIFQHGTQRRSNNEWQLRDSCELVRNGRIGKVTHAVVTVGPPPRPAYPDYTATVPAPDRDDFDWDLWLGPAAWRPYPGTPGIPGWQRWRDFGLASIGNWGAHVLDMAQWALGRDAESPVEVLPPSGDTPLALKYADGVTIFCPRTPGDSAETSVYGTAGQKIIFGVGAGKIQEKYDRTPLGPGELRLYRPENNDHNGNWFQCIRSRKKTICNEEVAYRSGTLCLLIAMMDRLGRPLRYDPLKAEFPGDDEANRLLDTPKRSPWRIYG